MDDADAFEQLHRPRFLQHEPARTETQRLAEFVLLNRAGDHDDTRRLRGRGDLLEHLHAVGVRHRHVEQQDVGLVLERQRDRFLAVAGLAHDDEVRLGVEQAADRVAEHLVVIGENNANPLWRYFIHRCHYFAGIHGCHCVAGTFTCSRAPLPGIDTTFNSPRSARTRSRIINGPALITSSSRWDRRPENEKPRPSSSMTSLTDPLIEARRTITCLAPLCLRIFVSPSWTMRTISWQVCNVRSASKSVSKRTAIPDSRSKRVISSLSACCRSLGTETGACIRRVSMRRPRTSPLSAACTRESSAASSSATFAILRRTTSMRSSAAEIDCSRPSWSSRAMRARSRASARERNRRSRNTLWAAGAISEAMRCPS